MRNVLTVLWKMWNLKIPQQVFVILQLYHTTVLLSSFHVLLLLRGVHGYSLSSLPPAEDGCTTICPGTSVTLTCIATGITDLTWLDQNGVITLFNTRHYDGRIVHTPQYNLTLVDVDIDPMNSLNASFITTLEVTVDNIENGTNITCATFHNQSHLLIYKTGRPSPPYNVMRVKDNFTTSNYSILLSWMSRGADSYTIYTNTSSQPLNTNTTTLHLEGQYSTPQKITVVAINCAGASDGEEFVVYEAGCPPPSPPANGSVSEFTSSRVGAQVTYSCDSDLVLVGERVATCSQPELQWISSSDDVTCVQASETECGYPSEQFQSHVSVSGFNSSVLAFSCDPGYSLHGSTTSQCVAGQWTPSPESVTCWDTTTTPSPMESYENCSSSNSPSTSEAVVITAVVCVVCSFTAGLLLGVLLTRCSVHCHRKQERGQTETVYETDILPEKGAAIELQCNEAYGRI